MKTIWKYQFNSVDEFSIKMPAASTIVHLASHGDIPTMWVLVDTRQPTVTRKFCILGTGHHLPDDESLRYVGTYSQRGSSFIGHVFEGSIQ